MIPDKPLTPLIWIAAWFAIFCKILSSSFCCFLLVTDGGYPWCGNLVIVSSLSAERSLPKLEPEARGLNPGTLGGVTFFAPWLKRWLRFMPPTAKNGKNRLRLVKYLTWLVKVWLRYVKMGRNGKKYFKIGKLPNMIGKCK